MRHRFKFKFILAIILLVCMQMVGAQTLTFQPTTTLATIRANNTSASDSFSGWSNNDARPGPVSHVPLSTTQSTLVHIVPWWGTSSHPSIGYNSADQVYIQGLVNDLRSRGVTGATWLWNGAGEQMDKSCLAMKPLFETGKLKYALMLSSTIPSLRNATSVSSRTTAMNNVMDYLRSKFSASTSQYRINGRPVILLFGIANNDYNWDAVRSHIHTFGVDEPLLYFRYEVGYGKHFQADGYFGWTNDTENWIVNAQTFGKDLIFGLNGGFDNSLASWGTKSIISQRGGQRFQDALTVMRNHPEIKTGQVVTWNDYEEGSEVETGLNTGTIITSTVVNNQLVWNAPVGAFDHTNVYISQDGTALMPIATVSSTTTTLDLSTKSIPFGTWYFVVEAVGQPMVQNAISNVVKGQLNWLVN